MGSSGAGPDSEMELQRCGESAMEDGGEIRGVGGGDGFVFEKENASKRLKREEVSTQSFLKN